MRQQPGPMLTVRLTEDRRSRLDVGRHGGNPHGVPGAPIIPLRRHHEQLKNTCAVAAPTVGAGDLSYPQLRQQLWLWLDALSTGWSPSTSGRLPAPFPPAGRSIPTGARDRGSGRSTPPCRSRLHQRRLRGMAPLQSACVDRRMTSQLRSHCEDGHQAWPAKGRYTRHTAEASRRSREDRFAADVAAVRPTEERGRCRPRLGLVDLDTGEIKDL
jgi:hypothetical protein